MKILVIDDEPLVRQSLVHWIQQSEPSFIVAEARNGLHAQELLKQDLYDLIITDIRMPGMDGITLVKWLNEMGYSAPVILLTGYAEFEYALQAIRTGVYDYLLKPTSKESIIQMIRQIKLEQEFRKEKEIIEEIHHKDLLEKRMLDLLYDSPLPHYDSRLLPEYRTIHVHVIFPEKTLDAAMRFLTKKVLEEVVGAKIPAVVINKNNHFVVIHFMNAEHADFTAWFQEAGQWLEQWTKDRFSYHYGGSSENINEVSLLYLHGLNRIGLLKNSMELTEVQGEVHRLVHETIQIIEQEYATAISLKDIANRLYVNANYLGRLIKVQTGLTFSQHMIRVRLNKAKELLKESNHKLYMICELVGYTEHAYFSRLFKTIEGISPYKYRERVRLGQ
jgi:two-component system response regulator YesN